MSHDLTYQPDIDCVILRIQGRVTIELIGEIAPLVASMLEKTNCRRLLNDMSKATIDVSIAALFNSPNIMDESGVMRITKRALVVPPSFDEAEFLENVTRNRGHNLMIFKNIEEAEKWLMEK